MNKIILILFSVLFLNQQVLAVTLFEALTEAYKNNTDLNAERENINISEEDLKISKSSYLPSVTISGSKSQEDTSKLTNRSGVEQSVNDVDPSTQSIKIEQTLIQSAKNYYDIAFLQEQYLINIKLVEISLERYKRIKIQNEFGNASHLDVLSAEIDLNSDSVNLINTSVELNNSKQILNQILNRKIDTDFIVIQKVNINKDLKYLKLKEQVNNNNNNILLQQNKLEIAETDKKINRSYFMPKINLSGQYGYSNMQSNTSIITDQTSLGTTGSVSYTHLRAHET